MIYAHLNQKDFLRVLNAYKKVAVMSRNAAKEQTPIRFARRYVADIIHAIGSQKYADQYLHYGWSKGSERYYKWKLKYGMSPEKYWVLYGDLLLNVRYWKKRAGWFAGVPAGVKDSGGKSWRSSGRSSSRKSGKKKEIAAYGWIMEGSGTGDPQFHGRGGVHPPRPVFEPTLEDFITGPALHILNYEIAPMIEREWS